MSIHSCQFMREQRRNIRIKRNFENKVNALLELYETGIDNSNNHKHTKKIYWSDYVHEAFIKKLNENNYKYYDSMGDCEHHNDCEGCVTELWCKKCEDPTHSRTCPDCGSDHIYEKIVCNHMCWTDQMDDCKRSCGFTVHDHQQDSDDP